MMSDVIARLKEHQTPTPSKWREWQERGIFLINLLFISEKSHNFVASNSDPGPPYLRLTQGSAPTLVRLKCV